MIEIAVKKYAQQLIYYDLNHAPQQQFCQWAFAPAELEPTLPLPITQHESH